jgi:NADH-quinone oxidoreductase subunit E
LTGNKKKKVMLSKEEQQEIGEELKSLPKKSTACIDALRIVQKYRKWISDESIRDIANFLEMSPDHVDDVATFYNKIYRKPVGEHVIHVCDSISCWIMGYKEIYSCISEKYNIKMGETSKDGKFTLLPIQCLGTCDRAPALMINQKLYRDLTVEKLDNILKEYENEGDNK